MALSQVDHCNAALVKIGQDVPITAMSEQTKAARAFTRVWDRILALVLAEHPWPFSIKTVALSPSVEAAMPGWGYRYAYPDDCVTLLYMSDAAGGRVGAPGWTGSNWYGLAGELPFDVISGSQGTSLLTDITGAYATYSALVTETSRFPALFSEMFICRLAMEVAPALAGELGMRMAQQLSGAYEMARAKAIAHDFNESRDVLEPMTASLVARGGY